VAVVTTLAFGGALGWSSRWSEVRAAALIGAGVIVAGLMTWALSAPPAPGDAENETMAGAVVVFYPIALSAIGALLAASAAACGWVRRRRAARGSSLP
jgi:hypothetical protein